MKPDLRPSASASALPLADLCRALDDLDPDTGPAAWLSELVRRRFDQLPLPGSGATMQRWRALAAVAERDLSLAKLFEGHTDALAIMRELGEESSCNASATPRDLWGVWAAEAPGGRTVIHKEVEGRLLLRGGKCWCSGAGGLSHGLLTAWHADGRGPQLVSVAMEQAGVSVNGDAWQAVGMAGSASIDVTFNDAEARSVGGVGEYLARPGFWQGGAGIAACWYGGARALGNALRRAVVETPSAGRTAFRLAALGKVDLSLQMTAALLRDAAHWIDDHPVRDASEVALRVRLAAEACAKTVLDEAGRSLGAAAFCRDARFARAAADLPVFIRQSHAERDFAALGERLTSSDACPWTL